MPDVLTLPSDPAIREVVGAAAFLRGTAYAQEGRVDEVKVSHQAGTIFAHVVGTAARRYQTIVVIDDADDATPGISAHCTCPVGGDCKHAAAAIIAARDVVAATTTGSGTRGWRRPLDDLVRAHNDGLDKPAQPLGLRFDIVEGATGRYAHSTARRVTLRPVTTGQRGTWIRSGTSWSDFGGYSRVFRPDQQEVVRNLYAASRPAASYGGPPTSIDLDRFGSMLWRLLADAGGAGIPFVAGSPELEEVRLAGTPATVSFDVREEAGGLRLVPRVDVAEDGTIPPEAVELVGTPAHGLFHVTGSVLRLASLATPMPLHLSRLLTDRPGLAIPPEDVDGFLTDYYPTLRQVLPVTSSDESVQLPETPEPRLALTLGLDPGPELSLSWAYTYSAASGERRHRIGAPQSAGGRDPRLERALLVRATRIVERWPQLLGRDGTVAPDARLTGADAIAFTGEAVPVLRDDDGIDVESDDALPTFRETDERPLVRLSASDADDDADWFDLRVSVTVSGEEVPFDALFTALARDDTHLVLDSGTYFRIDLPELQRLRGLIEEARNLQDHESDEIRISTYQAGLWEELVELGVVDEQSERWERSIKGLLDLDAIEPVEVPPGVQARLRSYQLDGFRWLSFLREHGLGGILADDMGLGKTLQTLAMIARAFDESPPPRPFLVVAPTSVVQNWGREAARFTPDLRVRTVSETQTRRGAPLADAVADAQVVVTSYALFRLEFEEYDALDWSGLVLDEAQFVKNHQAKAYQCARRLGAPFKVAITGTPLENNLMELWSLLSIVAPGLFPSPRRFKEFYRNPIERGRDPEMLSTLRRRIRPLMRRRTKEQVAAELPPKQEQVLEVALEPRHRRIYQTHLQRERQKILGLLDDLDQNRFTILRSLTLLRQLSLDPYLIDEQYAGIRSSKVDALAEQLAELAGEGHRALVFSQFTRFLGRVRDRLDADGLSYAYLDGRTRDRAAAVEEFKSGDAPVFLISLKAGGFGLNLTEADYCFVLDPWWNPAVEQQAVDRTHRIGQTSTVMVYRMVASDTIEEKVMELKVRKQELFSQVMDDEGSMLSAPLSASDIRGLLGVE